MVRRVLFPLVSMVFVAGLALAQTPSSPGTKPPRVAGRGADTGSSSPMPDGITAASARILIPDGTGLVDNFTAGSSKWFVAMIDKAKSYTFETINIADDGNANDLGGVALFEDDGTTAWSGVSDCATNQASPSLTKELGFTNSDGLRCTMYNPSGSNPQQSIVRIRVDQSLGNVFRVRMKDNNIVARWTTNGYNMFAALQNATGSTITGFVLYYPSSATQSIGYADFDSFSLSPYGAVQFTRASGALSSGRGLLRVVVTSGTEVNLQAYAFNPAANNYNFFVPERSNAKSGNDW
jgi:hypothetical protein